MSLKKVTTNITYKVPAWGYCNVNNVGDKCRFCIKEKGHYRCALYNMILSTDNGSLVVKTRDCKEATAGFKSVVTDVEPKPAAEPTVDPKLLMKTTLHMYVSTKKKLLAQGYPEAIADKVAQEFVLGGK